MADIRINELPTEPTPSQGDWVAIDGATTRKATVQAVTEAGRPVASQSEAEAGVNNGKVMTPLTVKQSIAVSAATVAQGTKADSALQPTDIGVTVASQANGALAATALQPADVGVTVQGYIAGLNSIAAFGFDLTDSADAAAARTTLALGTSATVNTGTSGATIPLLNGANTWSGVQTHNTGIGFGAGVASSPTDLSRHINLHTSGYGWSVTSNRLNHVSASIHDFYSGVTLVGSLSGTALTLGTNVSIAFAGTGAATTRTNLGAQAQDALLDAIAALTTAAGGFIRTTGVDTVAAQAIVGTVSQSGGTPTGSLFEEGSGANGSFIRLPSGVMLCMHSASETSGVTTADGSLFRSPGDITWTFPSTFAAGPLFFAMASRNDRSMGVTQQAAATTTAVTYRFWSSTSLSAGGAATARLFAIGRWF